MVTVGFDAPSPSPAHGVEAGYAPDGISEHVGVELNADERGVLYVIIYRTI